MRRPVLLHIVAASLVVVACSAEPSVVPSTSTTNVPDGAVLVSDDGTVTITPTGAADHVTIESVDPAVAGFPEGIEVLAAYDIVAADYDGGATVTVRTGTVWGPDRLRVPVGLLATGTGEWEVLDTATVSEADGEITAAFDLPRLATIVVVSSPWGIAIDPWFVEAVPGEGWDGHWSVVDASHPWIETTRPLRLASGTTLPIEATVLDLVDVGHVSATPRSGGAVSGSGGAPIVGGPEVQLAAGFDPRDPSGNRAVEVVSGSSRFSCLAPGAGVFGFQVEIRLDGSDNPFPGIADDRPASDPVVLRYAVAAPVRCAERSHTIASRLIQHWFGLERGQVQAVVDGMVGDEDPPFGPITQVEGVAASLAPLRSDVLAYGGFGFDEVSDLAVTLRYGPEFFGCGGGHTTDLLSGIDVTTVCHEAPTAMSTGGVVLVVAEHADALPRPGTEGHYTYAVAFDSDGDPGNGRTAGAPLDWDFLQGADRWYLLDWDPGRGIWALQAHTALGPVESSPARAIVAGNTIVWVVPEGELGGLPLFRASALAHDGTSLPEGSGGDVSGTDPTLPLVPVVDLAG